MRKASQPVAAFVFDTLGIIGWIAAAFWLYREEALSTSVPVDGYPNGIANYQLMHAQMEMLILACSLAIVGTLFLGSAAVVKEIYRGRAISPSS